MKTTILRRRLAAMVLAFAMALALPIAVAKQADAAWGCAPNYLCLYEHVNFEGAVLNFGYPSKGCHNVGSQFNDKISSLRNLLPGNVIVHEHINCHGWAVRIYEGEQWAGLGGIYAMNDKISSITIE